MISSLTANIHLQFERAIRALESLQPAALFAARLYLARVLFLLALWGAGRWSVDGWWLARKAGKA